jgi:hypothetical protein
MFNFFKRESEPPRGCNFHLAAREIARFLQTSNEVAKAQGGEYVYKMEFVSGWEKFAANPCHETAKQFLAEAPEYRSVVLVFFEGSCPGGQYYRRGTRTAAEFILGDYRLDMRLQDIDVLRELTKQEYAIFGRESEQEVIYHANPTEFVGYEWNMMVGTIEGKIYQLGASLAFAANGAQNKLSKLIQSVYERCEVFLGTPTEENRGSMIWNTNTGKVVFQYAVIAETETFGANLFVGDRGDRRYGNS